MSMEMYSKLDNRGYYLCDMLVEMGLLHEEMDAFYLWAFGEDCIDYQHGSEFAEAWNRRHWHEYCVQKEGKIVKDLFNMLTLWRDWQEKVKRMW